MFNEAVLAYDNTLAQRPKHDEALYHKGMALLRLQRPEDAIAAFDLALRLRPNYAYVWTGKGMALAALDHHKDAVACYTKAIGLDKKDARAYYQSGLSLSALGRYQEAIKNFDAALVQQSGLCPGILRKRTGVMQSRHVPGSDQRIRPGTRRTGHVP